MKVDGGKEKLLETWEERSTRSSRTGVGYGSSKADLQADEVEDAGGITPSSAMLWSSPSSTPEATQLCVGLLAAPLLLPAFSSSSSSSSPALAPSAAASEAVEAGADEAAASATDFAKATEEE